LKEEEEGGKKGFLICLFFLKLDGPECFAEVGKLAEDFVAVSSCPELPATLDEVLSFACGIAVNILQLAVFLFIFTKQKLTVSRSGCGGSKCVETILERRRANSWSVCRHSMCWLSHSAQGEMICWFPCTRNLILP
jgi:hypothetical protein